MIQYCLKLQKTTKHMNLSCTQNICTRTFTAAYSNNRKTRNSNVHQNREIVKIAQQRKKQAQDTVSTVHMVSFS